MQVEEQVRSMPRCAPMKIGCTSGDSFTSVRAMARAG
jgi:hypothetical protein